MPTVRDGSQDGAVTVFLVVLTLALLLVAGLVYDGGRVLAARQLARDLAGNAARAAAQSVDLDAVRAGSPPSLDALAAKASAQAYLDAAGYEGYVVVIGDRVEVTVSLTTPMALLQLAGITQRTVTGTGEARIVRGVTEPES